MACMRVVRVVPVARAFGPLQDLRSNGQTGVLPNVCGKMRRVFHIACPDATKRPGHFVFTETVKNQGILDKVTRRASSHHADFGALVQSAQRFAGTRRGQALTHPRSRISMRIDPSDARRFVAANR